MVLNEDIDLVKSRVSMRDIANYYGMRVNRKGFTLCPFHDDRHPSMQVFQGYTKNDGFYCRSCGAGGTIFNFIMKYEGKTFEEAVRMAASVFGVPISNGKVLTKKDKQKMASQRMTLMIRNEEEKIQLLELLYLSETIQLYECLMKSVQPYGELFCDIANKLPILKGEWDEKYNKYCDSR